VIKLILGRGKFVHRFITSTKTGTDDLMVAGACLGLLSSLAHNNSAQRQILSRGGLKVVIGCMLGKSPFREDATIVAHACQLLSLLTNHGEDESVQQTAEENGAVEALLRVLHEEDHLKTHVQVTSCGYEALSSLTAYNIKNQKMVVGLNGIGMALVTLSDKTMASNPLVAKSILTFFHDMLERDSSA
jgi:hypothetical protein